MQEVQKIAKHAFEKLYDHAKGVLTPEGRDMEKFVADVKDDWPFKTVSPEYFLDVTRPLMKLLYEIENEVRFDPKKAPEDFKPSVEILQDKVSYLSSQALECLHKLELETLWEEALMTYSELSGLEETTHASEMQSIYKYAEAAIFSSNRQMIDMLKHTYRDIDPELLYIDRDATGDANTLLDDAKVAFAYAYDAFQKMADNKEDILYFGMPAETNIGKLFEKMDPLTAATRSCNAAIIDYNIIARNDIDNIKKRTHAIHKAKHFELFNELVLHYSKQEGVSEKKWTRENYTKIIQELEKMDDTFKKWQQKILGAEWSADFNLTPAGAYSISIGYTEGKSVVADVKKDNVDFKKTEYKNSTEHTRTIECGQTTGRLKSDQESYTRMLRGETSVTSAHIQHAKKQRERRVFTNERQFGTVNMTKKQTTKYTGKKSLSLSFRGALAKWSGNLKKTHLIGARTKKKELINAQVEVAGGSVTATTKSWIGTPTLTAEAHAVEAKAKLLGAIEAKANVGIKLLAGTGRDTEIVLKSMAQVIGEEIANGGTNLIGITKNIEEMLNELPPSLKLDLGSFKISSAGFDLFSEQRKINEKTHEIEVEKSTPTYTKVREEFGDRHKYIAQAQETAKKMFVYDSEPYKADPNSIQVKHAQLRYEHEHSKNEDRER